MLSNSDPTSFNSNPSLSQSKILEGSFFAFSTVLHYERTAALLHQEHTSSSSQVARS